MRYLTCLSLVLVAGCTGCAVEPYQKRLDIDPELFQYFIAFERDSQLYRQPIVVDNLLLKFGYTKWLGEAVIGSCKRGRNVPVVYIDAEYWEEATDYNKEELIYHELGHCILNREHDTTEVNGIPKSLMFPHMLDELYQYNRNYYVRELFTGN